MVLLRFGTARGRRPRTLCTSVRTGRIVARIAEGQTRRDPRDGVDVSPWMTAR